MEQPVQEGAYGDGIIEECRPLLEGSVGGENHLLSFIGRVDDLKEVARSGPIQTEEPECIDHQEIEPPELFRFSFEGAIHQRSVRPSMIRPTVMKRALCKASRRPSAFQFEMALSPGIWGLQVCAHVNGHLEIPLFGHVASPFHGRIFGEVR